MRPTHTERGFTANREFTDRDDARARFRNAFSTSQAPDEYRVLNWYGVGGQGKSALAREFLRIVAADPAFRKNENAAAKVDFHDSRLRRPEEALLSIRLQLAKSFGPRFRAFDTAFARFFALTNPGIRMREKHPELFRGENELLNDLIDWSESGVDELVEDVAAAIPGLNVLYKYGSRMSARLREWYEQRGKLVLSGLDRLSSDEIAERLPTYLGADLCDIIEARPKARIRHRARRAVWEIQRRSDVLGEEHPDLLRTRYWLARVLDGRNRQAEADAILDGLDAEMSKHFSDGHRWRVELADYLKERGRP